MPGSRQLAAILFTDIVGYTALMGEDEHKAFELLKKNRNLQKPLIEQYSGKWIKEMGDGVLAIFSSATDAVACACSILKACEKVPGLQLRIGIHLGDIVFDNNDVFGDGVNIASRLQALAPVQGIWISEPVYNNVSNKKGFDVRFVKEEILKNVKEQIRIYEVNIESFNPSQYQEQEKLRNKKMASSILNETRSRSIEHKPRNKGRIIALIAGICTLAPGIYFLVNRWKKVQTARNEWIPEIRKMAEDNLYTSSRAFDLATEAERYIPGDSNLSKLWPEISGQFSLHTIPSGADVYWKDYNDPKGEWKLIGKTPLKDARVPMGFPRVKIERAGFIPLISPSLFLYDYLSLMLDSVGLIPENMVRVQGSKSGMGIIGLEQYEGHFVNEFLMDKFEVTNKEFKKFVDGGGYKKKLYWDFPFYNATGEIPWEKAMATFTDKTGKTGPAGWEAGSYPDGKDDHPVTGVSWYEAMAYAKFANKQLPTVFHWSQVANTYYAWLIIPKSNFASAGTMPVGSMDGISNWGVYDIGGNAREWCLNESDIRGDHYIMGGGWNDPTYAFNAASRQSGIDRSLTNGFRCMKKLPDDSTYLKLSMPLIMAFRDYNQEKPVDDKTFKIFLRQYAYDHSPFHTDSTTIKDSTFFRIEKIDIDAAYNKERMTIYLYLPKMAKPPYQTILYFPGSAALVMNEIDTVGEMKWSFDFLLKTGRAVAYPVYKGTYQRKDDLVSDEQNESIRYKDHVIDWRKDASRALDYLETRKDISQKGFGYYGESWGSAIAPIICAGESRFKAAVLHIGGLMMGKTPPEVDPFNFLSRVQIPVLMLNGKYDSYFPIETSQKPFFNNLGANVKDRKLNSYEGGHTAPRSERVRECLAWFDKYLGPI